MAPPMVQLYHNRNVNKNSLLFKVDYTSTKNDSIADDKNNAAIDSDPIKYKKFDYISEEENSQMRLIL